MIKWAVIGIVAVALIAGVIVVAKMGPSNIIGMIRYDQRKEGSLRVGDSAPDVDLLGPDGTTTAALSRQFGGRPVVLVFGSFT